jgi:hypothetical protein
LPHERAEVSVLEVLRQQLAGELVRLVNRELRAPLGPRHDVVASRVVHHVVPASERGWASVSGAPSRDKNRAIRDAQTTKCISFRDARTHTLRRKGGAASPVLDPIAPGGTSFAEPTPSGKAPSVARGAVRANRSRRSTRIPMRNAGTKRADKNFPFAFPEKSVDIGGHERRGQLARWHEWPERSDSRSDR